VNKNPSFFSLAELKQPVNQWICIAFLGVWCFWMALYYVAQKAQIIGENFVSQTLPTQTHKHSIKK